MAALPVLVGSGEDWTPSNYMPDVRVEIAFNAGYVTPSADRVWTDVSEYVELVARIPIGVGRSNERSTADANQVTLTLDNKDGRFTANRSASPYYPNVKIGRPIRVSVLTPTGLTSVRFVGFVDEWPVEWDGSDAYARASIRASSRLSRLGLTAKLKSMIEQEILAPAPIAYYTLGDPSGSGLASESSGAGLVGPMSELATAGAAGVVTFGDAVGVLSDGLTAMSFPIDSPAWFVDLPGVSVRSLRFCFLADAAGVDPISMALTSLVYGSSQKSLQCEGSGSSYSVAAPGLSGAAPAGTLHDVVWTASAADGERLYIDGVEVDTAAGVDVDNVTRLVVKGASNPRALVFCHVAIYDEILTPTQVAAQAEAALTGFAGERTDERLSRVLGWAGVAPTEVDAEIGTETMTYQLSSGMSAVDALREVESTEGGVLFDGPDGKIRFHNRSRRYLATAAVTLDMAAQHVGADFAPRLDRSTLLNDVTAENPTTGETARAVDTASGDEYGITTGSVTVVADSYDPLAQAAAWQIASYAEPRPRVPSLTVDVLAHVGLTPSADDLLQVGVGDRIDVVNAPSQADSTDASYFVEGYTETIGPESYEITFNLSPTHPALSVLILDGDDRGELDAGNLLAY